MDTVQSNVKSDANPGSSSAAEQLQIHLIRPCERYEDEYEQCQTYKSRRHQLYVDGQYADCDPWAQDIENCAKWMWKGDEDAARAIIKNETQRLHNRLIPHIHNKVWDKRGEPPADWNKPLPEFEKLTKNSYLTYIKEHGEDSMTLRKNCVIQ